MKDVNKYEYGYNIRSPRRLLTREFDHSINDILDTNALLRKKTTNELMKYFDLIGKKTIVFRAEVLDIINDK